MASLGSVGVLTYLLKTKQLRHVNDIYAYSMGALITTCYCVRGNFSSIISTLTDYEDELSTLQSRMVAAMLFGIVRSWNLSIVREIIESVLPHDVRMLGDLERVSGIRVHLLVSEKGSSQTHVFSSNRQPNTPLLDLLLATCAIPYFFESVRIGNADYIDGIMNGGFSALPHTITSDPNCLFVGNALPHSNFKEPWRIYESLYRQCRKLCLSLFHRKILIPPQPRQLFFLNRTDMQNMFFKGASIAAAETVLHSGTFTLPTARTTCCGITANAVLLELPALPNHTLLAYFLKRGGITVYHAPHKEPKSFLCPCTRNGHGHLEWIYSTTTGPPQDEILYRQGTPSSA